ncbi:MAG: type IV secretory system conjugative DNA transfer family protein [Acidimicrobiales bacterium]
MHLDDAYSFVRAASRRAGGGIYVGGGTDGAVWASPERAVLVLGPPRSGKTTSIVIPAILSATGPVVSTSTKPEVMRITADSRSRAGETLLYDPSGTVERPPGVAPLVWSPVAACALWDDARLVARMMNIASSSGASGSKSAPDGHQDHWHERAEALLSTLLHAASLEDAPMSTVIKWVDRHQAGPALSILDESGNELASNLLGGIAMLEQRELSGIWSTTSRVLDAYHSQGAMKTTEGVPFDASQWCRDAGTIYICASARHQDVVSPLVVGLLTDIRTAAYERARDGVDVTSPLLLALDEVANIAPLPDLSKTVSEGGGQGVITLACLQDLSQARARWGTSAEGWLSLFGTTVVLPGIQDVKTLEMLSSLAGEEEVVTKSISVPVDEDRGHMRVMIDHFARRGSPSQAMPSVTTSTRIRPRLAVDELSRGEDGKALVVDERSNMGYVKLTPWFSEEPWRSVVSQNRILEIERPQVMSQQPSLQQQPQQKAPHQALRQTVQQAPELQSPSLEL